MNENNLNNRINEEGGHIEHNLTPRVQRVFMKANSISLTHQEKHQGAHALKHFMAGGVTEAEAIKLGKAGAAPKKVPSPYFDAISTLFAHASISLKKRVLVPVAAILIFTLAAGTTYAASEALPGDALYPVKININENIQTALAVSGKAKAKVAVEHAVNRLEEAERLAAKGELKPAVQADLVARFNAETDKVDIQTENLKVSGDSEDADNIKNGFENSLRVHNNVIAKISERTSEKSNRKNRVKVSGTTEASSTSSTSGSLGVATATSAAATVTVSTSSHTSGFTGSSIKEKTKEKDDEDNNDSLSEIKAAVRIRLDSGSSENKSNKGDKNKKESLSSDKKERKSSRSSGNTSTSNSSYVYKGRSSTAVPEGAQGNSSASGTANNNEGTF